MSTTAPTIQLFDSHTHLDNEAFDADREEVISRAREAGVTRILSVGAGNEFASAERAIELARTHEGIVASAGIHPHDTDIPLDIERLQKLASQPEVVAVGETGLDFYRDWAPVDKQREWFVAQIELALVVKKPIIIHSREAGEECFETLQKQGASAVGGVFHCFAENAEFAARLREMNFCVSFPGTVTFKKADALRETVAAIPLEQILIETDAPYMAPVPYRGKRCETSFVLETAKMIASVKGITLEECAAATTANACKLFSVK